MEAKDSVKNVFQLTHSTSVDGEPGSIFLLGFFSTAEKARNAIETVSGKPGFRDYPDGFIIKCREIVGSEVMDGIGEVWLVEYSSLEDEAGFYFITDFGIFASEALAEAAVSEARASGEYEEPESEDELWGFFVSRYYIDRIEWSEGFVGNDNGDMTGGLDR